MADEDVIITGLEVTRLMLIEMPGELSRKGIEKALRAGSRVFEDGLAERAPHRERPADTEQEFPPLSDSIVTEIRVDHAAKMGYASTGFGDAGPVALWNEYGHEIVTHAKVDTGKSTRPNPFMRRTVDEDAEPAIDAFADSIYGTVKGLYGGS